MKHPNKSFRHLSIRLSPDLAEFLTAAARLADWSESKTLNTLATIGEHWLAHQTEQVTAAAAPYLEACDRRIRKLAAEAALLKADAANVDFPRLLAHDPTTIDQERRSQRAADADAAPKRPQAKHHKRRLAKRKAGAT